MTELNAIVWDLDGTISDTEVVHSEARIRVLKRWVDGPVEEDVETVTAEYAAAPSEAFFAEMFEKYGYDADEGDAVDAAAEKRDVFDELVAENGLDEVPGARGVIEALHNRGYRLAIASASGREHIRHVIESFGIDRYFEGITSAKECENGKPNPDVYELAADRLGLDTECCLAIEDSPNGVESAVRSGMTCIRYTPFGGEALGAHFVTDSLEDLTVDQIVEVHERRHANDSSQ